MDAGGEAHGRKNPDFSKGLTPEYSTLLPGFPHRFPQLVENKISGFSGDFSEMVTIITHCSRIRQLVLHRVIGFGGCTAGCFLHLVENPVEKLGK